MIAKIKNTFEIKNFHDFSFLNIAWHMKKPTASGSLPNKFIKIGINKSDGANDDLLMRRISNNDVKAFQLLYDRYWETLYLYACAKLPSAIEARYIIEMLFVHIWNNRNCLHLQKKAKACLFQDLLKKKIINYYGRTLLQ